MTDTDGSTARVDDTRAEAEGVSPSVAAVAEPALLVSGARKTYRPAPWSKPRVAVEDVSISVPEGSIHGLLGPNGAGKTTTLKMLLGLVRADGGTFRILGDDPRKPAGRRELGFLPEQPYFPTQLTGAQAMRLYARLAGVPAAERAGVIDGLLERVGLERHAHARLQSYSRGMLQRLGIAQALVGSPRLVVLDEPASGLDPVGQRDVRELMLGLKDEGVTVLLSSHQLSEVEAVCDRVTVLNRGRSVAEGRIDDLLNVRGRMAFRVTGLESLPAKAALVAEDAEVRGGILAFSAPDELVRTVIDAVDDAGGRVVAMSPKRESLEDYFTRLLQQESGTGAAS